MYAVRDAHRGGVLGLGCDIIGKNDFPGLPHVAMLKRQFAL